MNIEKLTVSAPGRICLFGEHQDYLGLPVITAAINLRISIQGEKSNDRIFHLDLPDIEAKEDIDVSQPIQYIKERDYFRSGLNVLLRENVKFSNGYNCIVQGNIPINSGASSSSALIVAWIQFLLAIASDERSNNPLEVARLAHQAEVVEFKEPGGMMDHYAASFGGILYIDFSIPDGHQQLYTQLGNFVLGDSLEPKDTKKILARVKGGTLEAVNVVSQKNKKLNIKTITLEELEHYKNLLSREQFELLKGNIVNRELTQDAKILIRRKNFDHRQLGQLLNAHQQELRDRLRVSTTKIDGMIDSALESGALGAKINGSGGGGCMFAYAPDSYEQAAEAIARAGGKPYIISIDKGVYII
ncbi:hypothetical protein AMJ80_08200 [bacterium SM23_31]|nr:MAG: hypothetical protein AMJ80_08200 [bacterium SM23_31]